MNNLLAMSPIQALEILDISVAQANLSRAQHMNITHAVGVLETLIQQVEVKQAEQAIADAAKESKEAALAKQVEDAQVAEASKSPAKK